tara:strand:- start:963 stop:1187 length:225 start_codon:yes stop_codon:yes gene_type:complete
MQISQHQLITLDFELKHEYKEEENNSMITVYVKDELEIEFTNKVCTSICFNGYELEGITSFRGLEKFIQLVYGS